MDPLFHDRVDAGAALAKRLWTSRGSDALVLGIPRGGVLVAAELARALDLELDIVVARKLGAPGSPELAIGAVTADGGCFLNRDIVAQLGVTDAHLRSIHEVEMAEARRRETALRQNRARARIRDRIVFLVDDGLATGATMRAAVRAVREGGPSRLIVAVPVGSRNACADLAAEADEVICLYQPEGFGAVGYYYRHFEPVGDDQVRHLLEGARVTAVP